MHFFCGNKLPFQGELEFQINDSNVVAIEFQIKSVSFFCTLK